MAAQRAARRFVMVIPAGNAAHIETRVAFGFGKPCYAVGRVAKTETLYGSPIGCLPVRVLGLIAGPYRVRACDLVGVRHVRWSSITRLDRRNFQDRPMAVADLRRNSYSVRYSHLAQPHHSVRVSLVSARRIRRRSGLLGARVDRFRVRPERLLGECRRVWHLERVQGRSCTPPCGLVGRQFGRYQIRVLLWVIVSAATYEWRAPQQG
jgi:hypothetical protein